MIVGSNTIVALATGSGGAISVVRVSGHRAIEIVDKIFTPRSGVSLALSGGFTLHYGDINDVNGNQLDDVIVSLFRAPRSYTGEDMVEISTHASTYIVQSLFTVLLSYGCTMAQPGEFTLRAYTNGKMGLVEAEAVADLIAAQNASQHRLASNQMRGGYSKEFSLLRQKLLDTLALIELELDFGEEDVEFADMEQLMVLLTEIDSIISRLVSSFSNGNAIKSGVPVVIVGSPNAGKSTLLNAILKDDRAIVSEIAGTTRDIIEEYKVIGDIKFRFIDTAGLRQSSDKIESMGIGRTYKALERAEVVIHLLDATLSISELKSELSSIECKEGQQLIRVFNKCEMGDFSDKLSQLPNGILISAKEGSGIDILETSLSTLYSTLNDGKSEVIISNARHYELLQSSQTSIQRAKQSINAGLSGDIISQDLRESAYYLGSLTGEITTDDILTNIFANFCIGK